MLRGRIWSRAFALRVGKDEVNGRLRAASGDVYTGRGNAPYVEQHTMRTLSGGLAALGFTQVVQSCVEGNTASSERVGPALMAAATALDLRARRHTFTLNRARVRATANSSQGSRKGRKVFHARGGTGRAAASQNSRKKGRIVCGVCVSACVPSKGGGLRGCPSEQ